MDAILGFFSDLILFTAGLVVALMWVVIIIGVSVEIYDLVMGNDSKLFPENEEDDR